jgi:hypothetical protein
MFTMSQTRECLVFGGWTSSHGDIPQQNIAIEAQREILIGFKDPQGYLGGFPKRDMKLRVPTTV